MQGSPILHLSAVTTRDITMQLGVSEPQAPYTDDFPRYLHGAMAALLDATNTFKSAVVRNTALAVARKKIYQAYFRLRNDLAQLSTPEFLESIALEAVTRDRAHACPSCVAETFFTALGYDGIAEMCGYRVQSALKTTVPQYPPPSSFALSFLPAPSSSIVIVCPDHGHAQMPTEYVESSSQSGSDSDGGRRSPRVNSKSSRTTPYTLSIPRGRGKQQRAAGNDGLDGLGHLLGAMNLSSSRRRRRDRSFESDSSSLDVAQSPRHFVGPGTCSSLVDPVDEIERGVRLIALKSGGRSSFAFSSPSDSDTN